MISRFTHLIYGRSSVDDDDSQSNAAAAASAAAAAAERSDAEPALLTTSAEESDEWLIVERSDCEAHDIADDDFPKSFDEVLESSHRRLTQSSTSTPVKSESSNTSGSEETSDFERFRGPYISMQDYDPQSDTALSDVSSQPEQVTHPSLEECWIVTPPPCFTASESSADTVVAMHPLENLLIEHPSMSVYWPRDRRERQEDDVDLEDEGQGHAAEGQGTEVQGHAPESQGHGQDHSLRGQGHAPEGQGHSLKGQGREPEAQGQGRAPDTQGQLTVAQVRGRVVEQVVRRGGGSAGVSDNGIVSPPRRYPLPSGLNQTFDYRSPYNFRRDQYIRIGRSPSNTSASPTESSPSNNTIPPTTTSGTTIQGAGTIVLNMQQQQTMERGAYSFLTPHNIRLTADRVAGSYLGLFVRGSRESRITEESQKSQKLSVRSGNSRKVLDQQNRVREFEATGKIRQRKDRMSGCPSGRSNNRKC